MSERDTKRQRWDGSKPVTYFVTDEQLQELLRDVSLAAYRAGKYRGEFNGSKVDPLGQQIIERKVDNWWEQNKDEYL